MLVSSLLNMGTLKESHLGINLFSNIFCLFPAIDLKIKDVSVKSNKHGHIEGKLSGHKSFLQYIVFS